MSAALRYLSADENKQCPFLPNRHEIDLFYPKKSLPDIYCMQERIIKHILRVIQLWKDIWMILGVWAQKKLTVKWNMLEPAKKHLGQFSCFCPFYRTKKSLQSCNITFLRPKPICVREHLYIETTAEQRDWLRMKLAKRTHDKKKGRRTFNGLNAVLAALRTIVCLDDRGRDLFPE